MRNLRFVREVRRDLRRTRSRSPHRRPRTSACPSARRVPSHTGDGDAASRRAKLSPAAPRECRPRGPTRRRAPAARIESVALRARAVLRAARAPRTCSSSAARRRLLESARRKRNAAPESRNSTVGARRQRPPGHDRHHRRECDVHVARAGPPHRSRSLGVTHRTRPTLVGSRPREARSRPRCSDRSSESLSRRRVSGECEPPRPQPTLQRSR